VIREVGAAPGFLTTDRWISSKNRIAQLGSPEREQEYSQHSALLGTLVSTARRLQDAPANARPLVRGADPKRARTRGRVPDHLPASSDVSDRRVSVGRVDLVPGEQEWGQVSPRCAQTAFYVSYPTTLTMTVPFTAVQFSTYEYIK
jgi:hypothetical protein